MPIRDDLILRMLDQIGEVAVRVLGGRAPGGLEQAERELASAYQELTGSGRALVARLSSEQLLAILGAPSRFNRERGYLLARLLEVDAQLLEARARPEGAGGAEAPDAGGPSTVTDDVLAAVQSSRLKALDLYLEATAAGLDEEDLEDRIRALEGALATVVLPEGSHWRVFEHAADCGRFAQAEDLLFDGLERFGAGADVVARGRAFYRDLLARPDAELAAGELPRDEVSEGRAAFEAELGRAPRSQVG